MNGKTRIAALLLAASVAVACVSRWNAGNPTVVVSAPPSSAIVFSAPESASVADSLSFAFDREGARSALAEVAGVAEGGGTLIELRQAQAIPIQADAELTTLRMPIPFRTQKDGDRFQGSNCGPAALGMVLDAFGMARGNADLRFLTHTYQGTVGARTGIALQHVAHVAADLGLEPRGLYQRPDGLYGKEGFARWTVDDVRAEVLAGRPVIPLVKFRLLPGHEDSPFRADHYVVIHGVDGDSFLYHDPIYESPWEGGARWMSSETLAAAMRPTLVPQQAVSFGAGRFAGLSTAGR